MDLSTLSKLTEQLSNKLSEHVDNIQSLKQWRTEMNQLIEEIYQSKLSSFTESTQTDESSLDSTNWLLTRHTAHQLLDSSIDFIQSVRNHPVWRPIPKEIRTLIEHETIPEQGQPLEDVCHEALTHIIPYTRCNAHPRFWGWVIGDGTFGGVLAEMLIATFNISVGGSALSAVLLERTIIRWMREIFGFPQNNHSGILVSGTSMATIIAMAVARQQYITNVRQNGIVHQPQMIVYASTEVHICIVKALELIGFGSKSLRLIPVDDRFSMDIDVLKFNIENDRKNGFLPFCIVGIAGTVNTGAFDNLAQLAIIAREEKMWFHIDGAFGSLVILDPERRHLVEGIELADSLAFDFHKWLHCQYDAGCILIRDGKHLLSTFSSQQSYLFQNDRLHANDQPWFSDLGVELSRSFRALKVWFIFKEHGIVRLGQKIAENCQQAQYLATLLEQHNNFIRIIRPVTLNIVNFRLEPRELDIKNDALIDRFNSNVLADIQMSGVALASTTRIYGQLFIRICIVGHRTIRKDFDIFVETLMHHYHCRLQHRE